MVEVGGVFLQRNNKPKLTPLRYALINIFCLLAPLPCLAARVHIFDRDGTIVHDSGVDEKGKLPGWWNYWVLPLMKFPDSGISQDHYKKLDEAGKLPNSILLTRHEVDLYREKLAKREGRPGDVAQASLLEDPVQEVQSSEFLQKFGQRPRQVALGFYMIVPQVSYALHSDKQASANTTMISYTAARERARQNPDVYEWRGNAFPYFDKAIANQDENNIVMIMTDSEPSIAGAREWMSEMHVDGFLKSAPWYRRSDGSLQWPTVVSMTGTDGRFFGSIFDFNHRKPNALADLVSELSRSTLSKHEVISPDLNTALTGKRTQKHEVIFYENNPEYVSALVTEMKKLATYFTDVKLVLYHAGKIDEVKGADFNLGQDQFSRWVIFTPSGKGWRKPLPEELQELEAVRKVEFQKSRVGLCAKLFGGGL